MARADRLSLWQVFRIPLLIFCLSLAGLVWALLVAGTSDVVASLVAAAPLFATVWCRLRHRRRDARDS